MKAEPRFWPDVGDEVWGRIRAEYTLSSLDEVRARFGELHGDPEPLIRQLVRVFIGDETYCPGFQFTEDGALEPAVIELFRRALALKVPHNVFAAWMVTPLAVNGPRPVEVLQHRERLAQALDAFARNRP